MARSRTVKGWPVLLGLVACSPTDRLFVSPPPLENARAMIAAIDGVAPRAVDLDRSATALELQAPSGEAQGLVEVLLYAEPLSALGFVEGVIPPTSADREGRPLPHDPRPTVFQLALEDGADARWIETSSPSLALSRFRAAGEPPSLCYRLRFEQEAIDTVEGVTFAVGIDGVGVLLSSNRRIWLAGSASTREVTVVGPPSFWGSAAHRGDDGTFYFGAYDGKVYTGRLDGLQLSIAEVGFGPAAPRKLAGGESEIFAVLAFVDGRRTFGRFLAGQWEELDALPSQTPDAEEFGNILRYGPGSAAVGYVSSPEVLRYTGGALTKELPGEREYGVTVLANIAGYGELAGTAHGRIFQRRGNRWQPMPETGVALSITGLAPFEDGFFFAGVGGVFGYFKPAHGVCVADGQIPANAHTIVPIPPIGDRWLFAGDRTFSLGAPRVARVTVDRGR